MTNIINDFEYDINEEEIKEYVNFLKKELNRKEKFSLVFVDNNYIKELNKEFRQIDKVTDVLTFPENTDYYLGDVIISYPRLIEQAKEYEHSNKRELYFLITHGFLHLLGYDHLNEEEEKIMFKKQEELLNKYDIRR